MMPPRLAAIAQGLCLLLYAALCQAQPAPDGDSLRGKAAIERYGCAACHVIPGIPNPHSKVAPPLTKTGTRAYIAGVLANTPANMVRWLRDPPAVDPLTAMPDMGVTEQDARDIAAYLYTLR